MSGATMTVMGAVVLMGTGVFLVIWTFRAALAARRARKIDHCLAPEPVSGKIPPDIVRETVPARAQAWLAAWISEGGIWPWGVSSRSEDRADDGHGAIPLVPGNGVKGVFALLGMGGAAIGLMLLSDLPLVSAKGISALFVGGVAGWMIPEQIGKGIRLYRRRRLDRLAPDMIDLLMLGVEAGMTFDAALLETEGHIRDFAPELAGQMQRLSADLLVLPRRRDAFDKLYARTGAETLRYLAVAIAQGEHYGTPLAASLRVVAEESRRHRLIERERQAARLPVLLSLPLILFIVIPIVVISAGPGFVSVMRLFDGGGH
ncbi:type II secretion system F family protein [Sneathiella chinensis]|uniref:Type II secretion system protein GspF domain-containing protein n=1 Tax=Sneathiella chinensis TaxID=349750 RepID=A0ABQ5U5X2_9PROT|nr:type II secretion system F family protein [Sneathiella chinensis]GLQ06669.1 hypothetical protein GCM10007924_18900 [Sneathiella chinensis]